MKKVIFINNASYDCAPQITNLVQLPIFSLKIHETGHDYITLKQTNVNNQPVVHNRDLSLSSITLTKSLSLGNLDLNLMKNPGVIHLNLATTNLIGYIALAAFAIFIVAILFAICYFYSNILLTFRLCCQSKNEFPAIDVRRKLDITTTV